MRNGLKFTDKMAAACPLTAAEQALVDTLHASDLTHSEIWDGSIAAIPTVKGIDRDALKAKIKEFVQKGQNGFCYYCGVSFILRNGERGIRGAQRDHIAAKSDYKKFTFEPKNIILACAKCNSTDYKGNLPTVAKAARKYHRFKFLIVHPYFDKLSNHLKLQPDGRLELVRNSKKGKATKDMFGLDETFEVELRAVCQLYDELAVNSAMELKIALAMTPNRTVHKK
jgi:uncharacterized protein (TIGR02646 family)